MYIVTDRTMVIGIFEKYRKGNEELPYEKGCIFEVDADNNDVLGYTMQGNELVELMQIPKEVEPYKHCYTEEKGFYPNPNWSEPNKYGIPDEILQEVLDDHNAMLIEGGIL